MKNERLLLDCVKGALHHMEALKKCCEDIPPDLGIPGFDDGKICGLSAAISSLKASLAFYEKAREQIEGGNEES